MNTLRTALLVLAALVAGAIVGHRWTGSVATSEPEVPRSPTGSGPGVVPPASPTLGGAGVVGHRSPLSPSAPPRDPAVAKPARPRPATPRHAVFEVLVTDVDEEPVHAQVYAVPRGTKEWNDAPEGYHDPPGPCRISIPVPGRYDLFARSASPPGVAGAEDVRIRAGETVYVHLEYTPGRSMRFVAVEPWPLAGLLDRGRIEGLIHVAAARAKGWRIDGRGHALGIGRALQPGSGPWVTCPLPLSLEYEIEVSLKAPPPASGERRAEVEYGVVAEPRMARAGDTVRLHASELASLHLHLDMAGFGTWPSGPGKLEVRLVQASGSRDFEYTWRHKHQFRRMRHPRILRGSPGPARIEWDGTGVRPGELGGLVLVRGRPLERRVSIEVDLGELPSPEALAIDVVGLSGGPTHEEEWGLELAALLPGGPDDDWPNVLKWGDEAAERVELDCGWRRAEHVLAWQGRERVSHPTVVPTHGALTVRLEPAGLLILVPDRLPPPRMGVLRIRRADGLPFLVWPWGSEEPVVRRSSRVQPGDLVGPFPPGRHVFHPELMGERLADVAVEVAPGRIEVLRVSW